MVEWFGWFFSKWHSFEKSTILENFNANVYQKSIQNFIAKKSKSFREETAVEKIINVLVVSLTYSNNFSGLWKDST